jgi:hypothetical protein
MTAVGTDIQRESQTKGKTNRVNYCSKASIRGRKKIIGKAKRRRKGMNKAVAPMTRTKVIMENMNMAMADIRPMLNTLSSCDQNC